MSRKPKRPTEQPRAELREEAGRYAGEAVLALVELMRNSSSDPVRVAAARELLDRAHGKPKAEADKAEGQSLQEMVRAAFEREDP
jgi:hypothetical protein